MMVISFLFFDGHVYEVLVVAIEDVDVHIAFDAIYFASVGMLPEDPRSFVFERVDVVVRYPVGVSLEVGCVEVGGAELVTWSKSLSLPRRALAAGLSRRAVPSCSRTVPVFLLRSLC